MIIAVSIIDKHKPEGARHVGTYMFEIPYDGHSHFDFLSLPCDPDGEEEMRPYCGRLLQKADMPEPINGEGEPV